MTNTNKITLDIFENTADEFECDVLVNGERAGMFVAAKFWNTDAKDFRWRTRFSNALIARFAALPGAVAQDLEFFAAQVAEIAPAVATAMAFEKAHAA